MSGETNGRGALRIGIAGLGTVGGGLLQLLANDAIRTQRPLDVIAVSARNRSRKRDVDITAYEWFDDPVELAADPRIDIFVELIGGSDGPAKRAVEVALKRGAHVVTANKALLAEHGAELVALSEQNGGALQFEAAVAGGIPVVKAVRESLAGVDVRAISGILNGTCNYLLSEMETSGRSFEDVLADAQRLGYAEADPTMDVGGYDAGHKIALLAAIAFGQAPDYSNVAIEGVDHVTLLDIKLAGKLGYRIKLVAKAERVGEGVRVQVNPVLLAFDHPLANVSGALNAVVIDGEPVGRLTFIGRGAGAGPTASAVAADLADIADSATRAPFGRRAAQWKNLGQAARSEEGRFFLRLLVKDRPGVIAAIAEDLAQAGISIESFLQDPAGDAAAVPIVLTTQVCPRSALENAVQEIGSLDISAAPPRIFPIEDGASRKRAWSAA